MDILKTIQDTVDKANKNEFICSEVSIDTLLTLRDNEIDSIFYFKVVSCREERGKTLYSLEYLPSNGASQGVFKDSVAIDGFKTHLDNWLNLLSEYNLSYPLFEDPILNTYYNELSPSFEILEPDADTAPYNFEKQAYITNIYNKLIELILKEKPNEDQEEAEHIISMIEVNKKQIPKQAKKKVIENLKRVVAHCFKYSFEVGKSIAADVIVEVGKRLLTGG
ncbi:MAG: hypothetical protein SFV55_22260 [Haliscomenobacter sp.]|uniref:hypothetical protein n=1 Tax=Haliscomenobacter sp. TaxID=2717303 RepID=UPI0029B2174A|nr:hypothetical protein [Haliscomenobacter sp.]MDX2071170.1 hypothetical protein [Haliscomenobacter sp.]